MDIHEQRNPPSNSTTQDAKTTTKVLIVDDMEQVRKDLRVLLQVSGEVEVVGEAGNGDEAIQQAQLLRPDVILMDLEMPRQDGLSATRRIRQVGLVTRIVVLSVHSQPQDIERAFQAGADDFIPKGSPYPMLMGAILNQQKEEKK